MALYKEQAIVLKTIPFEESGKLVTFFSKQHGKIKVIAKGSRRPTSRFGGRLEPFTYNDLLLAKGRELDILSQIEVIESFRTLVEKEETLEAGFYFLRLVNRFTDWHQKNQELFTLLLWALYVLEQGVEPKLVKKLFEIKLLKIEGFKPQLGHCVNCRKKVVKKPVAVHFDLFKGGILCSKCGQGIYKVPWAVIEHMLKIQSARLDDLKGIKITANEMKMLDSLVKSYLSIHLGEDVREW